jgi:DNA-binding MarR family transcriptional regulator
MGEWKPMSDATTTKPRREGATSVAAHVEAWGSLSRTYAAVSLRLQEALAQNDHPPLPWFEVLAAVAAAPERRMRMGDLAEALVMTRGGLTKLVDRLVKAGLLERTFCESDRRVSYATLLPAGAELLAEMQPVIAEELEAAFAAKLGVREARELSTVLERVRSSACGE